MKYWYLVTVLFYFSCSTDPRSDKNIEGNDKEPAEKGKANFEQRAKQEVAFKLGIDPGEQFRLTIYRAHLNDDQFEDAIITVNRLEFAQKESAKSPKGDIKKEYGYMGNYNAFFLYDGNQDKISIPMNIASSAKSPLEIHFENIQSENYKNVTITYRIRNSAFKNYYFWQNDQLLLVFQWKLYDQVGLSNYEANFLTYEKGSYSSASDILIYKGKIKNYSTSITDVYDYHPEIEKEELLNYRFFFDPKGLKYMTQSKAPIP